jgi:hypothetical protein
MPSVSLTFASGDQQAFDAQNTSHSDLKTWLQQTGPSYGLPDSLSELNEVGKETLESLYPNPVSLYPSFLLTFVLIE